jgi:hypothetical protein
MPHCRVPEVPLADRLAFSLAEVSGPTGLSVSYLYELIKRGVFHTKRVEGRRIAMPAAAAELLGVSSLAEVLGTPAEADRQQPPASVTGAVVPPLATTHSLLSRALTRRCAPLVAHRGKQKDGPG